MAGTLLGVVRVIYALEWSDLDPAAIRFDPEPARVIAEELVMAAVAAGNPDRKALGEAIDQSLLAEYGAWVAGWQWSASEPGCGGPVRSWCCPGHSLLRGNDTDPRASVDRVVAAVCEWHAYLVHLAEEFASMRAELEGLPLEDLVEHSAARLLPEVVERTRAERADSHIRYIEQRDRTRDPARADRMLAALAACRTSARRGDRLTFDNLAAWQRLVLGVDDAPFRRTDAHARVGRERYAYGEHTRDRFEACLADAERGDESVAVRAARVYLDICFFHPFADGNARAARLALDYVITRAGLALHAVEPLFIVARSANDARGAWCLALVIESLSGRPAWP